jgi:hypothetical protein
MNVSVDKKIIYRVVASIIVSAAFSVMFVGFLGEAQPNMGSVENKLQLTDFLALKKENNLDITIKMTNTANNALPINELNINGIPKNSLPDIAVYLNGLSVDNKTTPIINLKKGETANIEVIVPTGSFGASFDLGVIRVDVLTPGAYFSVESQSFKPLTRDVS